MTYKIRLCVIAIMLLVMRVSADTYTKRAIVVTQDTELVDGAVVYVLSVERADAESMVHRFCILTVQKYSEYLLSYDTPSGADIIHVPCQILDMAKGDTNKALEEKYHFYKPQLWLVGEW